MQHQVIGRDLKQVHASHDAQVDELKASHSVLLCKLLCSVYCAERKDARERVKALP